MKSTYKAVEVSAPGILRVVERSVPEPGVGQVRIRVEACGICHTDAATGTAKVIRRFKSTLRSFSKRIGAMSIMHGPHALVSSSFLVSVTLNRELMGLRNGFQNKRVVILGGSSGIGLAVAEQAASRGAKVVTASSNAGPS